MRISNIQEFSGGADAVVARELVNGEKRKQRFNFDVNGTPLSGITVANIDIDVAYATTNLTYSGRNVTIGSQTLVLNDQAFRDVDSNTDTVIALAPSDTVTGTPVVDADTINFDIEWPSTIYPGYVPFNSNSNVPTVVYTIRVTDAGDDNTYAIRGHIFMRYGVTV